MSYSLMEAGSNEKYFVDGHPLRVVDLILEGAIVLCASAAIILTKNRPVVDI